MVLGPHIFTMHYGLRAAAMGAMPLRISDLCLSFSRHPNISDENFNLVHHFICVQIFQINEEELESKGGRQKLQKLLNVFFRHIPKLFWVE